MNPADEMAAKIEPTERQLAGAVPGSIDKSIDKLDEQLRVLSKLYYIQALRGNLWRN